VQLLNISILNILVTALLTSAIMASAATVMVRLRRPARGHLWLVFLAIFAFSMLGFVTGQVMGQSRESAVGTVVPAVLTLLGGVAVYVVGSKGVEVQANVSAMVLCFAVTLLIGTLFGSKMRFDYDYAVADPVRLRNRELALQQNRSALEIQRLEDYIELLKLKRDFTEQEKLDLSRFESSFEIKSTPNKEPNSK
jgi:ABC-type multidrug transport system fused ATPase/permease subunit